METVAQAVWLLQVVPAALMVYDCVLSLDDEVEYIWKKQFSFISVIYVIHECQFRYLGTIYTLISTVDFIANENTTKSVVIRNLSGLNLWLSCLANWFVQIILALRLYALYGGSRKVVIMTALGLVVESIIMISASCLT
ncbi:hypothetical protein EV401DRAFT_319379 [Pisolithus croceorrhizus]|nr:hypothetical protein EV401DRAFT_319379 [Pisolithus croceorrhizus]